MNAIKNSLSGPVVLSTVLVLFGVVGSLIILTSATPSKFANAIWFLSFVGLIAWLLVSTYIDPQVASSRFLSREKVYPIVLLDLCYLITWSSCFILYYSQSAVAILCLYLVALLFVLYVKYGSSRDFKNRFAVNALIIILLLTIITLLKTIFSQEEIAPIPLIGTILGSLKDFNLIDQGVINNSVLVYYLALVLILWFMFAAIKSIQPEPKDLRVWVWRILTLIGVIFVLFGFRPIIEVLWTWDTARITSFSTGVNIIIVTISIVIVGLILISTTPTTFKKDDN